MYGQWFCLDSSLSSRIYISGSVQGTTCLYCPNSYPANAIGPVSFHWKPVTSSPQHGHSLSQPDSTTATHRTLWVWAHPSIYQQLLDELVTAFSLNKVAPCDQPEIPHSNNPIFRKYPRLPIEQHQSTSVTLRVLKHALCRFKLRGPLSHVIASDALKSADVVADDAAVDTNGMITRSMFIYFNRISMILTMNIQVLLGPV